jgi:hypothetical protein
MLRVLTAFLLLFSVLAFAAACGGDDDDGGGSGGPFASGDDDDGSSGDDDDTDDGDSDDDGDSGSDDDGDDDGGGSGSVDLDDIPAGSFAQGTMHLEISGDEDEELDLTEGAGFATGEFGTFSFTDQETIVINLAFGTEDEPGAITVVTEKVVTGAVWGEGCDVSFESDDNSLRGEFSCENLEGYAPGDFEVFENLDLRGTFELSVE